MQLKKRGHCEESLSISQSDDVAIPTLKLHKIALSRDPRNDIVKKRLRRREVADLRNDVGWKR